MTTLPYGAWPAPLHPADLTRGIKGFSELRCVEGALYYLESRPEELGRTVLMQLAEGRATELTPAPFNVRSRVHEYGGGAYLAQGQFVWFVNFADQNIYQIDLADPGVAAPRALTQGDASMRFSDFACVADGSRLFAVAEQHTAGQAEPDNLLVQIDTATGALTTVHSGHDFYAAPRVAPDGSAMAFIVWDHPHMPWDGTQLLSASLTDSGLGAVTVVAGGAAESVLEPHWTPHAALGFASDRSNYWNIYRSDASGQWCVHADDAEYAAPPWVFGMQHCVALDEQISVAVRNADGVQQLCLLDARSASRTELNSDYLAYHSLSVDEAAVADRAVYCIADRAAGFPVLLRVPLSGAPAQVLALAAELPLAAADVAVAEPLEIRNRAGNSTYAYYYAPRNSAVSAPAAERPPLLVLSHGGPTSACSPALNLRIQYYTTRGWAVVDVNYTGSTGYGRRYRDGLRSLWGVADVEDCEDVALHLARQGLADGQRLAIKGGSAGGYTTLAALTFGNTFRAGASHYGIGDLQALAAETHKFEARYIDALVPADAMSARSPLNRVDDLSCPVIFFQGADDRVVPPNQAQQMVAALRRKGLPVAYVEFAGEGHGFRQAANIQYAAAAEYQFFCTVFAIEAADQPPELEQTPLKIENWPRQ